MEDRNKEREADGSVDGGGGRDSSIRLDSTEGQTMLERADGD